MVLRNHCEMILGVNTVAIYVQSVAETFRCYSQSGLPLMKSSPANYSELIKTASGL